MTRKYTVAQTTEAANLLEHIAALSNTPHWEVFMDWLYRQACFPTITLTDPNHLVAIAQQARMNLFMQVQNKVNETKKR